MTRAKENRQALGCRAGENREKALHRRNRVTRETASFIHSIHSAIEEKNVMIDVCDRPEKPPKAWAYPMPRHSPRSP